MFEEYKNEIVLEYESRKKLGKLSVNLIELTPGRLRDECIIVYHERPLTQDNEILRAFFGPLGNANSYDQLIDNIDIDKFRPLIQYLTGITTSTARKNIELLAWLIDFKSRPYTNWLINPVVITDDVEPPITDEPEPPTTTEPTTPVDPPKPHTGLKIITTLLLITVLSFGLHSYQNYGSNKVYIPAETPEKCMHWTGNRYEPIDCNDQTSETPIIAINFQKLNHFKKIACPDKLNKKDIGKVGYAKPNGELEFYTDSGTHPIDTNRVLSPLTDHMLKTHTSYYRYLLYCVIWEFGIIVFSIVVVFLGFKYLPKRHL